MNILFWRLALCDSDSRPTHNSICKNWNLAKKLSQKPWSIRIRLYLRLILKFLANYKGVLWLLERENRISLRFVVLPDWPSRCWRTQIHTNDVLEYTNALKWSSGQKESNIPELAVWLRSCVIIPRHRELLPEGPGGGCLPLQTGFLMEN